MKSWFVSCVVLAVTSSGVATPLELWFPTPAKKWTEALPVGNGRLGAMVFGGVEREQIQFNEDTLWTGSPHNYAHAGASKHLAKLRELLFAGKQKEAEELGMAEFMSQPIRQCAYQPFGDVFLEFNPQKFTNFRRSLNLDEAVAVTTYESTGVTYTRRVIASYPDRVIVIELTSSEPGRLEFRASLTTPQKHSQKIVADDHTLCITGAAPDFDDQPQPGPLKFAGHLRLAHTDGKSQIVAGKLVVSSASRATLILSAATSFVTFRDVSADPMVRSLNDLEAATSKTFAELEARHTADHQALFRRFNLTLGAEPAKSLPTDERILAAQSQPDPALAALFVHYGRYLMIASSRPDCQPANLQGVWNDQLSPPWDSKYTSNINVEMNYWITEPANLAECGEPLFAAIGDLVQSGAEVAREHYGAPGWVMHHNFDLWRGAAPINASNHGIWPTGGVWLCHHLWEHYLHNGEMEFLRTTAYPAMKGATLFCEHYLVEDPRDPEKHLISGPSNSPEQGGLVMGPTMDHQLIRDLLTNTIAAAEQLQVDDAERVKWRELRDRIAPHKIGKQGQLQEWLEDVDDPDNRHRHVSHLWGLYPGDQITPDTPREFAAAKKSLEFRGDGGTGWSIAWKINLWARLHDGDHALKVLNNQLTLTDSPRTDFNGGGVYANLFDAHPPFQIDGNFGASSGVCEMLVQSHRKVESARLIELLPALPNVWKTGELKGLRARDGFTIDLAWSNGQLQSGRIVSQLGKPCVVRIGEHELPLKLARGESLALPVPLSPKGERGD